MAKHIQQLLNNLAGKVLGPEWRVLRLLMEHWKSIVGDDMAEHACPVGVTLMPNAAGSEGTETAKLFVRIPGALAPQFQMMHGVMLERINQLVGYNFITKIIFEHKV
ncbi:MAG: DciA family protein [Alphaproteobacteria bacterium]|nr:DciA family protein [Alphaproteobacteria bacterium]